MVPNKGDLTTMAKTDKEMHEICTLLAGRERSRKFTTALRVVRLLGARGIVLTKAQASDKLKKLEACGVGTVTHMKIQGSVIHWTYDPISVGKVALGKAEELKPQHLVARVKREYMAEPMKQKQATETVRSEPIVVKGRGVTVEIPANTTRDRIEEIIQGVRGDA